jgi:glutamate racemase
MFQGSPEIAAYNRRVLDGDRPLGVFDSGIGGITILGEIRAQAPGESCIYVADSLEAPYGTKSPSAIKARCDGIVGFLLDQGVKAIVVACNTASVVALPYLRSRYHVPFIGLDPGIKPAAKLTATGRIGVLTTPTTASSERLEFLIHEFAYGTRVMTQVCPGLVPLIERGIVDGPEIDGLLRSYLAPIIEAGADVVVLGCSHYPLVRAAIERICGPRIKLVDPSSAIARQVSRVLSLRNLSSGGQAGNACYWTTGDVDEFARVLAVLTNRVGDSIGHVSLTAPVA